MTETKHTIRLRALRKEDAEITWKWRNLPDVKEFAATHPFFVNLEKERIWYEKNITSDIPMTSFGIEIAETETLIGLSFLMGINMVNRSAEIGILMGDHPDARSFDFMKAIEQTISFGFDKMNLHRLQVRVALTNEQFVKLPPRFGFKKEGLSRESRFKNGKYVDEIIYAQLHDEYIAYKKNDGKN